MTVSKFRWRAWGWVTRSQRVCPVNAYARIIERERDSGIRVSSLCRKDAAANGTCFCGNPALTRPDLGAVMIRPGRKR